MTRYLHIYLSPPGDKALIPSYFHFPAVKSLNPDPPKTLIFHMSREPSPEIDDELFNEVYGKEYTGPPRPTSVSAVNTSSNKLLIDETKNRNDGNDDDMAPDPNAVPTDFTSREARVWEAKAKAIERNWKKRKEEELICKLCGEAGHFTQGCPSTLGANRKKADFFERVPARDKQVRSLFTEKVIAQIEKDVGCKIKLEEKFLIVSGKDRLILSKGVDAVHKLIQDDKNKNSGQSSISPVRAPRSRSPVRAPRSRSPIRAPRSRSPIRAPRSRSPIRLRRSRSPVRPPKLRSPVHLQRSKSPNHVQSPVSSYFSRHSESQRPHSSPRNPSRYQVRSLIQDRVVENRVREDLQKFSSDAPYAYANDGSRGQLARSRSPAHSNLIHDHGSFDGHNHSLPKTDNWNMERRGNDFQTEKRFDYPNPNPNPHNYEELELEFKRECMEVGRIRDHEEDEENIKHRECVQGLREGYLKKLDMLRNMHMKQWEEFLQLDIQKKNQQIHHNSPAYMEYNQARDPSFLGGTNLPIDSRNQPPYLNEEFPASMQHNFYGGDVQGQGQRNDEFGRTYGRY